MEEGFQATDMAKKRKRKKSTCFSRRSSGDAHLRTMRGRANVQTMIATATTEDVFKVSVSLFCSRKASCVRVFRQQWCVGHLLRLILEATATVKAVQLAEELAIDNRATHACAQNSNI